MTWELFLCLKKRFVHDVSQPRKVGGAFETRWIYFLIILFFGVCATGDLMYSWSLPAWRELIMLDPFELTIERLLHSLN